MGVALDVAGFSDARLRRVFETRVEEHKTLEEIGRDFGITRERVRQLLDNVVKKFQRGRMLFKPFLDTMEESIGKASAAYLDKIVQDRESMEAWALWLLEGKGFEVTAKDISLLLLLVRGIVKRKRMELLQEWPQLTYLACKIQPIVLEHPTIQREEKQRQEQRRKLSYRELAVLVLKEAGHPLHWKEIVERAYQLHRRDSFNATAMYNALQSNKETFVLTNKGTYGLVEWDLDKAPYYTDLIAKVLREESHSLPMEAIYFRVNKIRPIKKTSLLLYLEMHPRFYKAIDGTYGLRAWLPPREKQTLRTPDWLVEDSKSYKRVDAARERGYDIERIILKDRHGV